MIIYLIFVFQNVVFFMQKYFIYFNYQNEYDFLI